MCTVEPETFRKLILHRAGVGRGKGLEKCQLTLWKRSGINVRFSLFGAYMVASVLLPTTSARIFYIQKGVDPESERLELVGVEVPYEVLWDRRTVDGPTRK